MFCKTKRRLAAVSGVAAEVLLPVCVLCTPSCADPVPAGGLRRGNTPGVITLVAEPQAELSALPRVVRLHASYAPGDPPPEFALFSGTLSDYHARRIRQSDLPATLLERQVPILQWATASGHAVIAPRRALAEGAVYSLTALGAGVVETLSVSEGEHAPYFARVWPASTEQPLARFAVYCGPTGLVPPAQGIELVPASVLGELTPGVGSKAVAKERCFQLQAAVPADAAFVLPPPSVAGVAVDPEPLLNAEAPESAALACSAGEQALGPACLEVADDRLLVRTAAERALLAAHANGVEFLQVSSPAGRFVVRGLTPSSRITVDLTLLTASGAALMETRELTTTSALPHVVMTEVLANPAGSEPAQEWVEIVNDGTLPVDLAGFSFADSGAELPLQSHVLEPGQFALIVAEDFQTSALGDVPVPEFCPLLRLPKLGKNGLSNSGESVRIRSTDGRMSSQFPPLAATKPGVSLARREVTALDDDVVAFGFHGEPGASPCSANF
ncbi:MAG TPA: lamin tail domain-containing protein [Polyangiaceae bacterium]